MISRVPEIPIGTPSQADPQEGDAGLFAALLGEELQAEAPPESADLFEAAAVAELGKPTLPAAPMLAAALQPAPRAMATAEAAPEHRPPVAAAPPTPLLAGASPQVHATVIDSRAAIAEANVVPAKSADATLQQHAAASPPAQADARAPVVNATHEVSSRSSGLSGSGAEVVERIGFLGGVEQSTSAERGPRAPAVPTELASGSAGEGRATLSSAAPDQFEHGERGSQQGPGPDRSAPLRPPRDALRREETHPPPPIDSRVSPPAPASETAPAQASENAPTIGAGVPVAATPVTLSQHQVPVSGGAPVRVDELSAQVHDLAGGGGGTARLRLSPPQLGEIELEVTVRGDSVAVRIVAHEQAARSAVEDGRASLIDGLSSRSLRMESLDVSGGPLPDRQQGEAALAERGFSSQQDRTTGDREAAGDGTRRQVDERSQPAGGSPGSSPAIPPPHGPGIQGGVDLRV